MGRPPSLHGRPPAATVLKEERHRFISLASSFSIVALDVSSSTVLAESKSNICKVKPKEMAQQFFFNGSFSKLVTTNKVIYVGVVYVFRHLEPLLLDLMNIFLKNLYITYKWGSII